MKKEYLSPLFTAVDTDTENVICASTLEGYDEYSGEQIIIP